MIKALVQKEVQATLACPWTPVVRTIFAENNLRTPGTHVYSIPTVIPATATNVLVYVTVDTWKASHTARQNLGIFVENKDDPRFPFKKEIYQYGYPQDAIVTNSENMWFPMPSDRKIYLQVHYDTGPNCFCRMFAMGYN